MSEPITKRQRIADNQQSQKVHVQHDRSIEQASNLFDLLAIDLLALVFAYLKLDEKLLKLPVLDRSMQRCLKSNALFGRDTLVIKPSVYQSISRSIDPARHSSLIRMMSIVSEIELSMITPDSANESIDESSSMSTSQSTNQHPSFFTSLVGALARDSMTSFKLIEYVKPRHKSAVGLQRLLDELASINQSHNPVIKLSTLSIEFEEQRRGPNEPETCLDWPDLRPLFVCMNRTPIDLSRPSDLSIELLFYPVASHVTFLAVGVIEELPSTCTDLRFHQSSFADPRWMNRFLKNADWLPLVQVLDIDMIAETSPALGTIMNLTGKPRPYKQLILQPNDKTLLLSNNPSKYPYDPFAYLEDLRIEINRYSYHLMKQFGRMDKQLPQLRHLSFTDLPSHIPNVGIVCDLNPLLIFLSTRPIERLHINLDCEDWVPLSDATMHAWAKMGSLSSVEIKASPSDRINQASCKLFVSDDIRSLIPPGSWPLVTELSIDVNWSLTTLETFLCACPALSEFAYVHVGSVPFCPISTMTLVDRHCPLVKLLFFHTSAPMKRISPSDVMHLSRVDFKFAHLSSLRLSCAQIDHKTLHLFISKIRHAPLDEVSVSTSDKDSDAQFSPFVVLAMLRHFPLLELIDILFKPAQSTEHAKSLTRILPDGRSFPLKRTVHTLCPLIFADGVDEAGRTSRHAFFEFVNDALTVDEKVSLEAWDSNNYDHGGWM